MPGYIHNDQASDFLSALSQTIPWTEGLLQVEQADTIHEEMGNVSAIMELSGKPLLLFLNQMTNHYQHGKQFYQTLSIVSNSYSVHQPKQRLTNTCSTTTINLPPVI